MGDACSLSGSRSWVLGLYRSLVRYTVRCDMLYYVAYLRSTFHYIAPCFTPIFCTALYSKVDCTIPNTYILICTYIMTYFDIVWTYVLYYTVGNGVLYHISHSHFALHYTLCYTTSYYTLSVCTTLYTTYCTLPYTYVLHWTIPHGLPYHNLHYHDLHHIRLPVSHHTTQYCTLHHMHQNVNEDSKFTTLKSRNILLYYSTIPLCILHRVIHHSIEPYTVHNLVIHYTIHHIIHYNITTLLSQPTKRRPLSSLNYTSTSQWKVWKLITANYVFKGRGYSSTAQANNYVGNLILGFDP